MSMYTTNSHWRTYYQVFLVLESTDGPLGEPLVSSEMPRGHDNDTISDLEV